MSGYKWIYEKSYLFNSFENICYMINLPPERIRVWAKRLTKDQISKIEHLERESSEQLIRKAVDED